MAKTKRGPSEAERAERRARDRERLQQAARELLTSDGWQRWVRARTLFHNYTLRNCLLLAAQCRERGIDARRVVGFRAWLRLGRWHPPRRRRPQWPRAPLPHRARPDRRRSRCDRRRLPGRGGEARRLSDALQPRGPHAGGDALMASRPGSVEAVSEQLTFHVDYGDAGDGWTLARVRETPAIVTQGATVDEARDMVRSALRDWLEHYVADQATEKLEASQGSEPLTLTIAS
jgi:predicted RNase H-like HicB family nuclease